MPSISQTISMEDKVSPTLTKIQKNALNLAKEYERLEKEQDVVWKQLENLRKAGKDNSEIYKELASVYNAYDTVLDDITNGQYQIVDSTQEIDNSAEDLDISMTELNQTLEAAQKAWRMLTSAIREANEWMQASNVQFNAQFTAASKMHTVLGASAEEIQSLYDYAGALQKVGVVGDEAVISGMASLSMYTKNTEQIEKLIPKIVDMAVQENGLNTSMSNISSTATIVGRALTGQMTMLSRQLGLTEEQAKAIDNLTDSEERFNAILQVLNSRVGKANEALAATSQGGIKQAANSMSDLKERLGNQVIPYFELFNKVLVDILTPIVEFVEVNSNWLIPALVALTGVIGGLIVVTTLQTLANSALVKSFIVLAPKILAVAGPILLVAGILYGFIELMNSFMGTEHTLLGVTLGIIYLLKGVIQDAFIFISKIITKTIEAFALLGEIILSVVHLIAQGFDMLFGTSLSKGIENSLNKVIAFEKEMHEQANFSEGFVNPLDEARKGVELGNSISESISNGVAFDINKMTEGLDNLMTTDAFGAPALNTTSSDDLLKDEDIQLLLDVATRDFKLNYQHITPEITMTFTGDFNETADADAIIEEISNRMQEEVYNDLEVITA